MPLSTETLMDIYRQMRRVRVFEEKLAELVNAGQLAGFLHLYAGEEAVAVGVCAHLSDRDYVASTHRGHGHAIAKGVDLRAMMAELFGRRTGVCKGKGGSMHIADLDRGMLGANGIVGAGIPLTVGAALTAQVKRTGRVAVAFFGDGATNQGQFHEALNLAAVWKLPAVFVIENNGYGEATPMEFVTPVRDLATRAGAYAMASAIADGMDFFDVHEGGRSRRTRPRRRGPDAPRVQDLPLLRPLRRRPAHLPHQGGGRGVAAARPARPLRGAHGARGARRAREPPPHRRGGDGRGGGRRASGAGGATPRPRRRRDRRLRERVTAMEREIPMLF